MADFTVIRGSAERCNRPAPDASFTPDTDIVQQNVQSDYERGCKWACVGVALTFGPMLFWGILMGWL